MILRCQSCESEFEESSVRGLCPDCVAKHQEDREHVHERTNPAPGVHAVGKFAKRECPRSVTDPVTDKGVCPLCGSDELEAGYGFAGGYGLGSYNCCMACYTIMDFHEDSGE